MEEVSVATSVKVPVVLFFDSGVGGLSVFAEVKKRNPQCAYYYLFDHECFPYGIRSETFLKKRVNELLHKASAKIHPDLIVIACNTASTAVLPTLRASFSIPIVGVVPAIKPAAALSQKKHIALLATPGTVNRAYTDFLINEFAEDCRVLKMGSEQLVRLAENSLAQDLGPQELAELAEILHPITTLAPADQPDVVVLGCTHFPLLKAPIGTLLGPDITLVDSGEAVARRVQNLLQTVSPCLSYEQGGNPVGEPLLVVQPGPAEAFYTGRMQDAKEEKSFKQCCSYFGFHDLLPLVP